MTSAVDPVARILGVLADRGRIARSAVGKGAMTALQTLFDSGGLQLVRQGAGDAVIIGSREAFDRYVQAHYPAGLQWEGATATRAEAAIYTRDSKRGRVPFSLVTLHGHRGWIAHGEQSGAIRLGAPRSVFLDDAPAPRPVLHAVQSIALIENLEVFRAFPDAGIKADIAIWTAGRMPERLIDWLSTDAWQAWAPPPALLHCGDYDIVGLREFERVHRAVGERVRLFVPDDIETLFAHGSGDLLNKQTDARFAELLRYPDADCRRVAELILRHGRGLEQETLLTGNSN